MPAESEQLRYIAATQVAADTLRVNGFDVVDRDQHRLGQLTGFVVEPVSRQVHYLVVDRGLLRRRQLVPFGPAHLDCARAAVQMDTVTTGDTSAWRRFDPAAYPEFSDNDLISALFQRR